MTPSSAAYEIRKTSLSVETIWHERGPRLAMPLLVGTAIAVIRNPFAGRYEPDLMPFQASLRELGRELASGLIAQLGGAAGIEAYGKGIVVGEDGSWNMARCGTRPAARACARCLASPRPSFPRQRRSAARAHA